MKQGIAAARKKVEALRERSISCARVKANLPDARTHSRADLRLPRGTVLCLPRTLAEICENVRDFGGAGTRRPHHWMRCAPPLWHTPGEIRSITVGPRGARSRRGHRLMKALMAEAQTASAWIAFACHAGPEFFGAPGDFQIAQREDLPTRFTGIATSVPGYHCCDEVRHWCAANFPPSPSSPSRRTGW